MVNYKKTEENYTLRNESNMIKPEKHIEREIAGFL